MQLDLEKINRLPPDVRKRVKKLFFSIRQEDKKEKAQKDFLEFTKRL